MKKKITAIYCGDSSPEEIEAMQIHFFEEGYQWYSSKYNGQREFKKVISNYITIEDDDLLEANNNLLDEINEHANVLRFGSPVEYLRNYKIKKLKTKLIFSIMMCVTCMGGRKENLKRI